MPLDIIGPGFGRTGTKSLKLALEQLGFGPCHHMHEVRDDPGLLAVWQAAADGQDMDWEQVFDGYRAQVDWPGARYWRELLAAFPEARVVLSVRDPDDWFDSVQRTIHPLVEARGQHDNQHMNDIVEMVHRAISQPVFDDRLGERGHATEVFKRHIREVQSSVPTERLLTYDVKQGWEPLCAFLGVDIPETDFPRTNSSREFGESVAEHNRQ